MSVLLVDDHTILRQALCTMLGNEPDIEIVGEAGNGQAAVALTLRLQPDIVLMDVGMPVMDGIEATRAIHAECPSVCVTALSMHEMYGQVEALRDAGAMEYVTKSAVPDQSLDAIRACYGRLRFATARPARNTSCISPPRRCSNQQTNTCLTDLVLRLTASAKLVRITYAPSDGEGRE